MIGDDRQGLERRLRAALFLLLPFEKIRQIVAIYELPATGDLTNDTPRSLYSSEALSAALTSSSRSRQRMSDFASTGSEDAKQRASRRQFLARRLRQAIDGGLRIAQRQDSSLVHVSASSLPTSHQSRGYCRHDLSLGGTMAVQAPYNGVPGSASRSFPTRPCLRLRM